VTTLNGCASLEQRRKDAATEQGTTNARVSLPAWPGYCRRTEPHAPLAQGVEARSIIKRERAATDRANRTILTCAEYYDSLKKRLE
jgi:hypothetical protein